MATLPRTKTVTYEEWLTMPEVRDGREEVVNGEIRIMPPPKLRHTITIENVHYILLLQLDKRLVLVASSQLGVVIRKKPLSTRVPDLAVCELSSMVEIDGYCHSAPQLVVEVLSPSNNRREREEKLADYAAIGIPEVWVMSPEAQTVEVLYLEDGRYVRAHLLGPGDTLKPKLFPHVQVDIAQIWPD